MLDQLSMPYRIALGALLVLALAWFTVLKPGDGPAPAAPTAPVAAVTTAAAAPAAPVAASPTATTTAAVPAAAPTAAAADPATPVLADLDRGDVAVLAFLQPGGADDARVRAALGGLRGPVRVHTADIGRVGDYAAITRGVPVAQAPTTLVIGADHQAKVVAGVTTRGELQQLVDDQARR